MKLEINSIQAEALVKFYEKGRKLISQFEGMTIDNGVMCAAMQLIANQADDLLIREKAEQNK